MDKDQKKRAEINLNIMKISYMIKLHLKFRNQGRLHNHWNLSSKIKFNQDVSDPIFTMTVKDFQGTTLAGTNTDIEKVLTGDYKKGDIVVVEFRQKIPLTAGKYTLSFSCTKYNLQGELEVLNRKYDALLIDVITTKNAVGIIRLNSNISIKKFSKN